MARMLRFNELEHYITYPDLASNKVQVTGDEYDFEKSIKKILRSLNLKSYRQVKEIKAPGSDDLNSTPAGMYKPQKDSLAYIPVHSYYASGGLNSWQQWALTVLHEIIHSTGHYNRLNRMTVYCYSHPKYKQQEELTAIIGSYLLAQKLGIINDFPAIVYWLIYPWLPCETKILKESYKEAKIATKYVLDLIG